MKTRVKKLIQLLPATMLGSLLTLTACMNDDIYNPEKVQEATQEAAQAAFPVTGIDQNQTWETSRLCNATVTIKENSAETYTVKVLTANPYNSNSQASLLATAVVQGGKSTSFKFDIPAAMQSVFVMKVDSEGYSSAVPATVENGNLRVTFGEAATRTASTRSAITRAATWSPDEIPTSAPTTVYPSDGNVSAGESYLVTSSTTSINANCSVNLYFTGEVSLDELSIAGGGKVYLLLGAKLTLNKYQYKYICVRQFDSQDPEWYEFFNFGTGNEIYIAEGAEMVCGDYNSDYNGVLQVGLEFGNGTRVYNCGKIDAGWMQLTNDVQLVNGGTITMDDNLIVANSEGAIVNNGTIEAGSFALKEGASAFYNASTGEVTISGNSEIGSSTSIWDNQGTYRTGSITFVSNSESWYNRCKLYVDEDFNITTSSCVFHVDAGSYVECKNLNMDKARIELGANAFFNVTGTATFTYNVGNDGFDGTGSSYAVLKMNEAKTWDAANCFITYHGNLYVDCTTNLVADSFVKFDGAAAYVSENGAKVSISDSPCNPGYDNNPDNGGSQSQATYTYAFEDMDKAGGDYDFNDAVLYVTVPYESNGKKYIDVTLKAAGATKALAVYLNHNGKQLIFADAHTAMGSAAGTMLNTGVASGTEATATIEVDADFNLTDDGDIYIVSAGTSEVHIPNFTAGFVAGHVPYALRVASEWRWPKECVSIEQAYTGFSQWAQDATKSIDWYETPVEGNVY